MAGGTFVAALESINPLRMEVVRSAIPLTVNAIACPTATACVLVGSAPKGQGTVPAALYMTGAGAVWQVSVMTPPVAGSFSAVACPTSVACLAVGSLNSGPGLIDRLTLAGSKVQLAPLRELGAGLSSIACANATSCLVVGRAGRVLASPGEIQAGTDALIEATRDGGGQWHGAQVVGPDGRGGKALAHEQPWLPTVDGPLLFGGLGGVGCAPGGTTSSCDVTWPFWPAAASTSDGVHWYPNALTVGAVGGPGGSLSCPTAGRCFSVTTKQFVGNNDNVETVTQILETIPASPGWEWGIAGQGPDSQYSPSLVAISCPTLSTCVAVGSWYPASATIGSNPVYPLVMAPQLAMHPFFRAKPPPWKAIFTWQTLALVLGALSVFSAVGEIGDLAESSTLTVTMRNPFSDWFPYLDFPVPPTITKTLYAIIERAPMGVGDIVSFVSGALSTGIGAATTSAHDPIGWIAVGFGVLGLVTWSMSNGLASTVLGGADPTGGASTPSTSPLPRQLDAGPTPSTTGEG